MTYEGLFYSGTLQLIIDHSNDTTDLNTGPANSVYKRLMQRNRCIHRDQQNISVNGARTGATMNVNKTLSRNQTTDSPLLVFIH